MRITMSTMTNNILTNLNRTTTGLAEINNQISSGRKMSKLSDDPVNLTISLSLRTSLSSLVQYQENIVHGRYKLEASESNLHEVKEQIVRAKTLTIQAANATVTPEDRLTIASEIRNIFEQAISLGNSEVSGKYLFGGYRTSGYTAAEPTPFAENRYDGYRLNSNNFITIDQNNPPLPMPLPLAAGDLSINGIPISAAVADGTGLPYEDMSATAVAKTINDISAQTGVTASIVPAKLQGNAILGGAPLALGDLRINGLDITTALPIQPNDSDNTLISSINAQTAITGVRATNNNGQLVLSSVDGRNMQIETSTAGETATGLPDSGSDPDNVIHFGSIQLKSNEKFQVKTNDGTDTALSYIGLDGGTAGSGEPDDVAADGEIWVRAVANKDGAVRYNGDRENEAEIQISKISTLAIAKIGSETFSDSKVFTGLKRLENALSAKNYTEVTSFNQVTAPGNTLASGQTGLDTDDIIAGSFDVTVTDHEYYPPQVNKYKIPVDPAVDTPESIREKINGIPGLNATWDPDSHLEIKSDNPDRYTITASNDSSGYLQAAGLDPETWQTHALQISIAEMDEIMENLTTHISNLGARQNRLDNHEKILKDVELSSQEALSGKQDTDVIEAISRLKAKEFAYEAALQAAAKTMQLSLVNFL